MSLFRKSATTAVPATRRVRLDTIEETVVLEVPVAWSVEWYEGSKYTKELHNTLMVRDEKSRLQASYVGVIIFRDLSIPVKFGRDLIATES